MPWSVVDGGLGGGKWRVAGPDPRYRLFISANETSNELSR